MQEATGWRVNGASHPAEFEHPSLQRLLQALEDALRTQLGDKPIVIKLQGQPTEMFHINDARYMRFVDDPAQAGRRGYAGTESLATFEETALRPELAQLAYTDDQANAAIVLGRLRFAQSHGGRGHVATE